VTFRLAAFFALGVVTAGGVAVADASDQSQGAKRVTVYPLVAPTSDLGIYSRPIADALAKGLKKELGVEVSVSEDTGDAPAGVDLIIDGSILKEKRGIGLEARVRDPASGRQVGAVSARIRPLENLEASATELVEKLAPIASAWRKKERARAPIRLSGSVLEVPGRSETSPSVAENGAPSSANKRPPLFVVAQAGGNAAGGAVRVDIDATHASYAFAERLGATYATTRLTGSEEAKTLAKETAKSGALYVLALYLREVKFSYRGVLSARGSAVVRLIDRDGTVVMQKSVSTDTVVGSRGDRHTALIYAVAEQCLDIAMPDLKKALAK